MAARKKSKQPAVFLTRIVIETVEFLGADVEPGSPEDEAAREHGEDLLAHAFDGILAEHPGRSIVGRVKVRRLR